MEQATGGRRELAGWNKRMLALVWEGGVSAGLRRQREEGEEKFLKCASRHGSKNERWECHYHLEDCCFQRGSFLEPLLPAF